MYGDYEQIRMALKNIIRNAVQAMKDTGKLTVSARMTETDEAEIVISDTGPGISQENLGKIFEPLFTTRAQGIGFGLSITRMIAENHGGNGACGIRTGERGGIYINTPFFR